MQNQQSKKKRPQNEDSSQTTKSDQEQQLGINFSLQEDEGLYSLNRASVASAPLLDADHEDFYVTKEQLFKKNKTDSDSDSDDDNMSVLSEIDNESMYFEKKVQFQKRALFRKNASLQWRQKWTNVFQILTPIIGLLFLLLVQNLIGVNLANVLDKVIYVPYPYVFNLNYQSITELIGTFDISSCDIWYMFEFEKHVPQSERAFFGKNPGAPMAYPDSYGVIGDKGNIYNFPCQHINKSSPYFEEFTESKYEDYKDMNDYLFQVSKVLSDDELVISDKNFDTPYLWMYPDGAIRVSEVNEKKFSYNLMINDQKYLQYHRNNGVTKLGYIDPDDGTTKYLQRTVEGQINLADTMNQAYMRSIFKKTQVISAIGFYPFTASFNNELNRTVNVTAQLIFPLILCMGLPVFLYHIVVEKEMKLIETMKINGMRMSNYWICNFCFNLLFYCLTAISFVFFGTKIFGFAFFKETDLFLLSLILFGWGLAQISMAFVVSVFLNKAQTASIIGYSLSIWLMSVAAVCNLSIYSPPVEMDWFLYFIPTFTFARCINVLCMQCAFFACVGDISTYPSEGKRCLAALYISFVVYLLLAVYLQQVIPQDYGVAKPWNFCLKQRKKKPADERDTDEIGDLENERENQILNSNANNFDFDLNLEDADSKAERNIVYNLDKADYYKYPLIVKNVRKVYPGYGGRPQKVANKSMCLRIRKGEMFGLLGPNGAGKTTLISQLTGLYKPNSGNAWVAGYDIKDQLEVVQLQIGVCPQFDVLWNDLTVEEHLYFYARLKGITPDKEDEKVTKAIEEVLLQKFRTFPVKALSGGMKRRLSVAISLVSEPKIIYLDEPSTGLDPENRRQLWDILAAQKGKRAIIITTHSMEEADVLCNRIGIVNDGILRCIGPQVRLKSLYGGGYHLFINCQKGKVLQVLKDVNKKKKRKILKETSKNQTLQNEIVSHPSFITREEEDKIKEEAHQLQEQQQQLLNEEDLDIVQVEQKIIDFIKELQPNAILMSEFNGNFVYQIPLEGFDAERMFEEMEGNKDRLRITDWGLSQCSLEDVFSRICEH